MKIIIAGLLGLMMLMMSFANAATNTNITRITSNSGTVVSYLMNSPKGMQEGKVTSENPTPACMVNGCNYTVTGVTAVDRDKPITTCKIDSYYDKPTMINIIVDKNGSCTIEKV